MHTHKKKKTKKLRIFRALEEHTYIMIIFTIENHPTAHSLIVPFVLIRNTIIQNTVATLYCHYERAL